jgi:hypothetical protein
MSTLRAMADATAPLARAIDAVVAGADLTPPDVATLLPGLRALGPAAAPLAGEDVVDVATVVDVLRRRPGLLDTDPADADGLVVSVAVDDDFVDPRGAPIAVRAARAVVDAAVLALEAKKLAFGLTAPPAALKSAFVSPDEARATLLALRGLDDRVAVASSSSSSGWAAALPPDREVHVVAGAAARRVLDLLAPSVRRLRVELALAGRRGAVIDDDDVYRGLLRLHAADPATVDERRARDAEEGVVEVDDGAGFVVDATALLEDLVDRRARGLVLPLKKARVGIVGVVDPLDLGRVLRGLADDGVTVRSLQLLVPATVGDEHDDDVDTVGAVVDAGSGHVWPGAAATATLSLPWLGLAPAGVAADEGAFTLLQAAAAAGLDGVLTTTPRLQRVVGDDSGAGLAALARMVQVKARQGAWER